MIGWLKTERWSGVVFVRARMYAVRNSDGNSFGRASGALSEFSSAFLSSVFSGLGGLINVGCIFAQIFLIADGIGGVINGFFVLIIIAVVAMYNGNAASIKMPNTKPANPCSSACIKWRQYAAENRSKLNRNFSANHITAM